jgi:hypothetical protein
MALNHEDQSPIREYLLGTLTPDLQRKVEERLLTETEVMEELEVEEDELIDAYLSKKLNDGERDSFERHFMATAERHQKLSFARALKRYVTASAPQNVPSPPVSSPFWNSQNWALRASAAVVVIGIMAGTVWHVRQPSSLTFATYALNISSGNRADGTQSTKIPLPVNVDALRLRLMLPGLSSRTTRYRVELLGAKGETHALKAVEQDEQSVVVEIPSTHLSRGLYALTVYATKEEGTEQRIRDSYLFTVE